jgi:RIO kinase 1
MSRDERLENDQALDALLDDGLISEVVGVIRSGKEATVYACRPRESSGREYVAAKVYKALDKRGFRNDALYQPGRDRQLTGQVRRALANKSRQGRLVQFAMWLGAEFETLSLLHGAGADVPEPIASRGSTLLMEFIGGDDGAPAPMLSRITMEPDRARECLRGVLENVALWLRNDRIHGDLSPYNILYRAGRVVAIDFPQAIDPRFHPNAREMLTRDLENVCGYFERLGVYADPHRLAAEMWRRYRESRL